MKKYCVFPVSAGCLLLEWMTCLPTVQALVLYPSADPTFNTTAPGGALAGSGWQYTGYFLGFTGYPISPDAFLVSKHVVGGLHQNGAGGTSFSYLGTTYTTVARFDDPSGADLTVLRINPLAPAGAFPSFAPLYRDSDEAGKNAVILGRGLIRGAAVDIPADATTAGSPNGTFRGWSWGANAGPLRWGENQVDFTVSDAGGEEYLFTSLTRPEEGGLPSEASLAANDSSGGLFILDMVDGLWKLAGINTGVDSVFSLTSGGPAVGMGLVDAGGLYAGANQFQDTTAFDLIFGADFQVYNGANNPVGHIVGNYHARISSAVVWLDSITVPETSSGAAAVGLALVGLGGWAVRRSRLAPKPPADVGQPTS